MSSSGRPSGRKGRRKAVRKPPPHWRKYLTQAELELPPPAGGAPTGNADDRSHTVSAFNGPPPLIAPAKDRGEEANWSPTGCQPRPRQ